MGNSTLIRRGAEMLAALIIIFSTVVYTTLNVGNHMSLTDMTGGNTVEGNSLSKVDSIDNSAVDFSINGNESSDITLENGESELLNMSEDSTLNDKSTEKDTTQVELVSEPVFKYIETNQVIVRNNPDPNNEKITELKKGERVEVVKQQGEWLEIVTEDKIRGFILAEQLSDSFPEIYKYVNINLLNVRKGASSETDKLGELPIGTRIQVLGYDKEWIKITTDDNMEGYVFTEYTSDTFPVIYKYVNVNNLNIRKGPGSETEKIGSLTHGSRVQLLKESGDWIKILTKDGIEGYVFKKYVADKDVISRSSSGQPYNAELAEKIMEYAKKFAGVPYVYGGSTPSGFDCSGFTKYVYGKFSIYLPRTAEEFAGFGTKISRSELKPGDILLFDVYNDYQLGHVGIYLGSDRFIHASSSKGKVVIATLSKYGGNILGVRRVLK